MDSDYSNDFNTLRARLLQETGGGYKTFLQGLKPDYKKVWRDISFGYLVLALTLFVVQLNSNPLWLACAIPLGAVSVGYWVAYIQLFIHEAAHYNLWKTRSGNDVLCNLLISWQIGTSIRDYRAIHFTHHRNLGEPDDSEISYFNALTNKFIFEMLTGLYALKTLARRDAVIPGSEGGNIPVKSHTPLITGIAIHAALILALVVFGAWPSAVAWILGMAIFFPFWGALRQILEHRSLEIDPATDFSAIPHGAVTRIFGLDFFSRTFGGAGFNRHLLHHWEPQIPCTRLGDYETYLLATSAAPLIQSRRANYVAIFKDLYRHDNAR